MRLNLATIQRQLMPAMIGGGGAVANDLIYSFALGNLPPNQITLTLQTGYMRHVGKAASALILGWLSSFVVARKTSDTMTAGALTVVGYNLARDLVAQFAPDINMGMYLDPGMGMYLDPGMGYPGAGWNPQYGGPSNTMSALLPRGSGGRPGVPGAGVMVPPQLATSQPYAASAPPFGGGEVEYSEYA